MKFRFAVFVFFLFGGSLFAQQENIASVAEVSVLADTLPDAPSVQQVQGSQSQPGTDGTNAASPSGYQHSYGPIPPTATARRLTAHDKFRIYYHQTFGPPALIFPAFGAAIALINPSSKYPPEWNDGAGAFGRRYGSALAQQTSKRTAAFMTETLLHEDPRYRPAPEGAGDFSRVFHALAFTIVDKTDSGSNTLAFSNLAGAAAGGFVGMAYLPPGFDDITHAGQRASVQLLGTGIANVSREFAPQLAPLVRKIHLPTIVPAWWVPVHAKQP